MTHAEAKQSGYCWLSLLQTRLVCLQEERKPLSHLVYTPGDKSDNMNAFFVCLNLHIKVYNTNLAQEK